MSAQNSDKQPNSSAANRISADDMLLRLQNALEQRMHVLSTTMEGVEAQVVEQKTDKKRISQLEEENRKLLRSIEILKEQNRQSLKKTQAIAALEIGKLAKLLTQPTKAGLLRGEKSMTERVKILQEAGLFDPEWYLKNYPDLVGADIDAASHYVLHGADEGRLPRNLFEDK